MNSETVSITLLKEVYTKLAAAITADIINETILTNTVNPPFYFAFCLKGFRKISVGI